MRDPRRDERKVPRRDLKAVLSHLEHPVSGFHKRYLDFIVEMRCQKRAGTAEPLRHLNRHFVMKTPVGPIGARKSHTPSYRTLTRPCQRGP